MNVEKLDMIFQWIKIGIFGLVISTPCLWMAAGEKQVFSYTEKRTLATFPLLPGRLSQVRGFFIKVDNYLNDHFGFRELMVYRYQREVKKRFKNVERITKVTKGVDNWYFYTGNDMLKDFTGSNLRSDNELSEWLEDYRNKQKWLEQQGIQYLLIIPPNKMTIYGDLLGEPWVEKRGRTRLSQLQSVMSENDKSTFLDISQALLNGRHSGRLFFQSDTHWTEYGAFLGYLAIADRLESTFPQNHFKRDFTFSKTITRKCEKKANCGDLTLMLLEYETFEESFKTVDDYSSCTVPQSIDYRFSNLDMSAKDPYLAKACKSRRLKTIVFRDSFFEALEPYMTENFNEVIYLWKKYDQANVEELLRTFKPDIVIEERGERQL